MYVLQPRGGTTRGVALYSVQRCGGLSYRLYLAALSGGLSGVRQRVKSDAEFGEKSPAAILGDYDTASVLYGDLCAVPALFSVSPDEKTAGIGMDSDHDDSDDFTALSGTDT